MNEIDRAFYAMYDALHTPIAVPLYYNPLGYNTGLSVTIEDLEKLFPLMAKAAHLYRLHDGPAPAHWADPWESTAAKCAAVCRESSTQYLSICVAHGQPIAGEIRQRLADWDYMAALFSSWPARCGAIGPGEPDSIADAAQIQPVERIAEGGKGKPLYHLHTARNRQELDRIFDKLVAAGYIDGSAPEARADFLNAFDPAAEKQGRIIWIKKAKSHSINKMAICDFLRLFGITERKAFIEYAHAIFGMTLSESTLSNCNGGSAERDALRTIIDKEDKQ